MFHMMNEARIGVGLGATMLGYAGYDATLDYAKQAPAGPADRRPAARTPAQPQVPIIEHADVKRMLLAQKCYCEGALALELYCARLVDEQHTGDAEAARRGAPAAGGADADRQELAERVVPGGQQPGDPGPRRLRLHARLPGRAVLARQPPEHDPRGHARHPGARPAGPQGGDGRRRAACSCSPRASARRSSARASVAGAGRARATRSATALQQARRRDASRPGPPAMPDEALANATPYLQAFGHMVLAWIWLDVALAQRSSAAPSRARRALPRQARSRALLLPLRAAEDRCLARRRRLARRHLPHDGRGWF